MKTKQSSKPSTVPATSTLSLTETRTLYVVRTCENPPVYVGPARAARTGDQDAAHGWETESAAQAFAGLIGATVLPVRRTVIATRKTIAPAQVRRRTKPVPVTEPGTQSGVTVTVEEPSPEFIAEGSQPVAAAADTAPTKPEPKARRLKGLDRALVVAACTASGLPHLPKGTTDMYGDAKGARLVVPKGSSVTKLFMYKLERADLPGYHTAEQRKAAGIGSVSHIVEHPTMDTVEALLKALSPSSEGAPEALSDTPSGGSKGTKARRSGASGTNEGGRS